MRNKNAHKMRAKFSFEAQNGFLPLKSLNLRHYIFLKFGPVKETLVLVPLFNLRLIVKKITSISKVLDHRSTIGVSLVVSAISKD